MEQFLYPRDLTADCAEREGDRDRQQESGGNPERAWPQVGEDEFARGELDETGNNASGRREEHQVDKAGRGDDCPEEKYYGKGYSSLNKGSYPRESD